MKKINETTIPRNGLVGEYLLDGNANDTAGINNGTATNVTWAGADRGYVEEVGSFNGSSSKVDINNGVVDFTNNYSICLWMKKEVGGSGGQRLMFSNSGSSFEVINGNFGFTIYDGSVNRVEVPENTILNKLVFVCLIRNKVGGFSLYINNILMSHNAFTGNSTGGAGSSITIGTIGGEYYKGDIGLVRIYNRVLSETEIKNLYIEGLRKLGPTNLSNRSQGFPLYSLPNLEKGKILEISKPQTGGIYYDQTGNGNNGTATNVVDSTVGLNNVMSLSSGNIIWNSILFSTSSCWELVGGKWNLVFNPTYITSTGIASSTRTISNIILFDRVIGLNEQYQLRYGNTII